MTKATHTDKNQTCVCVCVFVGGTILHIHTVQYIIHFLRFYERIWDETTRSSHDWSRDGFKLMYSIRFSRVNHFFQRKYCLQQKKVYVNLLSLFLHNLISSIFYAVILAYFWYLLCFICPIDWIWHCRRHLIQSKIYTKHNSQGFHLVKNTKKFGHLNICACDQTSVQTIWSRQLNGLV